MNTTSVLVHTVMYVESTIYWHIFSTTQHSRVVENALHHRQIRLTALYSRRRLQWDKEGPCIRTWSLEEVGARILGDERRIAGHHDGGICFGMVTRDVAVPLLLLVLLHLADKLQHLHLTQVLCKTTLYASTAKTQYRKFKTNIPRKGIAQPQSQFPHSCVCERFIYFHDWSTYSAAGKYVDWSWEYINRWQTHDCGNRDWSRAIPFLGTSKWDFFAVCTKLEAPPPPSPSVMRVNSA